MLQIILTPVMRKIEYILNLNKSQLLLVAYHVLDQTCKMCLSGMKGLLSVRCSLHQKARKLLGQIIINLITEP